MNDSLPYFEWVCTKSDKIKFQKRQKSNTVSSFVEGLLGLLLAVIFIMMKVM